MELLDMMLDRSRKTAEQFAVPAAGLVAAVRPDDIVARSGGDEFMLVPRDCGAEFAEKVCERVRTNLKSTKMRTWKRTVGVTLSLGIARNDPAPKDSTKSQL